MGVICVGGDSRLFQSSIKNTDFFFLLKANETKSLKNLPENYSIQHSC